MEEGLGKREDGLLRVEVGSTCLNPLNLSSCAFFFLLGEFVVQEKLGRFFLRVVWPEARSERKGIFPYFRGFATG